MNDQKFDRLISKRIELSDSSIILLSNTNDVINLAFGVKVPERCNVCLLDKSGKILWWIQDVSEFILEKNPTLKLADVMEGWKETAHTNIWVEDGKLKTFNSEGYFFTVDIDSGRILEMISEKN